MGETNLLSIIKDRDKRTRAVRQLNEALKKGEIERGSCHVCGRRKGKWGESIQGHHTDYDKPLEVIWLCALHHKCLHINLRRKGLQLADSLQIIYSLEVTPQTKYKYAMRQKALRQPSRHKI